MATLDGNRPSADAADGESQRRILAGFLSRFTADRDMLITSVQRCEQLVHALARRLDQKSDSGASPSVIQEIQASIARLENGPASAAASARATAEQALTRAGDALQRLDAFATGMQLNLAAEIATSQQKIVAEVLSRSAADRDALMAAVQGCEQRMQTVAERLEATSRERAAETSAIHDLQQAVARLHHDRPAAQSTAEQALTRADEALHRLDEIVAQTRHEAANGEMTSSHAAAEHEALARSVIECVRHIEQLAYRLDAAQTAIETIAMQKDGRRTEPTPEVSDRATQTDSLQVLHEAIDSHAAEHERLKGEIDRLRTSNDAAQPAFSGIVQSLHSIETALTGLAQRLDARDGAPVTHEAPPAAVIFETGTRRSTRSAWAGVLTIAVVVGLAVIAEISLTKRDSSSPSSPTVASATHDDVIPQGSYVGVASGPRPPAVDASAPREAGSAVTKASEAAGPGGSEPAVPVESAEARAVSVPSEAKPEMAPAMTTGPQFISLTPDGARAYIIRPEQNRVCPFRSAGAEIIAEDCIALGTAQLSHWPSWLVASDLTSERIRMVDAAGEKRLKIVPERGAPRADSVQLAQAAYDSISASVQPWQTAWLVSDAGTANALTPDGAGLADTFERWRRAWEHRLFDEYASFYSAAFVPESESLSRWRARKQMVFERSGPISVQIEAVTIAVYPGDRAIINFQQSYRSAIATSRSYKSLQWQREGDDWKIRAETVLHEVK